MRKEAKNKLFSFLFLSIFFLKLAVAIAPLILAQFSKQATNAVIMQTEIEHDAEGKDIKEKTVKEYFTLTDFDFVLSHPELLIIPSMISVDHDKHVQAFYPPVPTPPPNV